MSIIQFLLISGLSIFILWSVGKDFAPWLKLLAIVSGCLGIVFVIFPSLANSLAHALNVGRGADLMLYFFVMLFFFFSVSLLRKITSLQNQITGLYRAQAKKEAIKPGQRNNPLKEKP